MINIIKDEFGEIISIEIDGEKLDSDDGELWIAPKPLFRKLKVSELPENIVFELCSHHEDNMIVLDTIPIRIRRIDDVKVLAEFEDSGTRKYWDGKIGFNFFMGAKKDIIEQREKELKDIKLESYEDDGAWIHLIYSSTIAADDCNTVVDISEQIISEIDGAAELKLGGEIFEVNTTQNEKEFSLQIILPILRKLGFQNIKYNHGRREYGKDIVFSRITEFGELEHWAAQVKFGDISGEANSEIDTIIAQLDDTFKMPYYCIYTRRKERISKLAFIISGKFTENAIEKICEKIEINALKNNVVFIDGDKIQNLIEKVRK
jgi:hypothetical protein